MDTFIKETKYWNTIHKYISDFLGWYSKKLFIHKAALILLFSFAFNHQIDETKISNKILNTVQIKRQNTLKLFFI